MTLATPTPFTTMDEPQAPTLEALRSLDPRIAEPAWAQAWPRLFAPAMALARAKLRGAAWEEEREDLVTTAIAQVQRALVSAELARVLVADRVWQSDCDRLDPAGVRQHLPHFLGTHLTALLKAERGWPQWRDRLDTALLMDWLRSKADDALRCNQLRTFDDLIGMTQLIVRRRIYDAYRANAENREEAVEAIPEPGFASGGADRETPRFTAEEILQAVDTLPAPFPALFRDRFLDGHSTSEIAARHTLPLGSVTTCLWRGLKKLRRSLAALEAASTTETLAAR
jgi:hypothetical protein